MGIITRVSVRKTDSDRIQRRLKEMSRRGGDWRPFWPVAQSIIHKSVVANFRQGGRPRKWKALSGWTAKVRADRGKSGTLSSHALGQNVLMETGALFQSIGNVNEQSRRSFKYGTNLRYARLQHSGTAGIPGGVLRPKKAKHLALPFPGVTGRPRDYSNTFVMTTTSSKTMWQRMDDGSARPLFLLKKSVRIPARPFMVMQKTDVDKILSYAAAYIVDPKKMAGLPSA